MSRTTKLTVHPRGVVGKANRRLAGENLIPAVLYGLGRESMPIAVDRHEFELLMGHHSSGSMLVELKIEGEKAPVHAMIPELQVSPTKGNILHVDFLAVSMDEVVHAVVAVHLLNDPEGVKSGGLLTIDRREINVEAKPGDLPESISFDVSALEIGDAVRAGDLVLPAGVVLLDAEDDLIASVTPPMAEEEPEETEEQMQPELIGEIPVEE